MQDIQGKKIMIAICKFVIYHFKTWLEGKGKGKGKGTRYLTSEVPLLSYRLLSLEADGTLRSA